MKTFRLILPILVATFAPAALAGNIANCEVILMEPMEKDGVDTGGRFASFRPAAEFMSTIYDEKEGHATQLAGHKIRGVMCTRRNVIPTLRDFPILATGLPFSVSDNFDAPDSNLMTLYFKEGRFHYHYKGRELSPAQLAELKDVVDVFNFQPHNLGNSPPATNLSQHHLETE